MVTILKIEVFSFNMQAPHCHPPKVSKKFKCASRDFKKEKIRLLEIFVLLFLYAWSEMESYHVMVTGVCYWLCPNYRYTDLSLRNGHIYMKDAQCAKSNEK